MDIRTGKIVDSIPADESRDNFVRILTDEMTKKQKETKQVSLNDHSSKLGTKLTEARRDNNLTQNRIRKLKRKGLLR